MTFLSPEVFCLVTEEVSQHLAGVSGVVEILLKHATNDELSNDVKQNSAICLAKLATADKRYCNTNRIIVGIWFLLVGGAVA